MRCLTWQEAVGETPAPSLVAGLVAPSAIPQDHAEVPVCTLCPGALGAVALAQDPPVSQRALCPCSAEQVPWAGPPAGKKQAVGLVSASVCASSG